MPWRITGTMTSPCSCKVGCPCLLGEMEADQGWCSGVMMFEIEKGNIDGVDVSGAKVAMAADWPGGFLGGNGKGRFYFDSGVSQQQRAALEPVLTGKRGSTPEVIGQLVPTLLPSKQARITVQKDADGLRATVEGFGDVNVKWLRGPTGQITKVLHGAAAFREEVTLGKATGSAWRDPELRQWQSLGHGEQSDFDWSG